MVDAHDKGGQRMQALAPGHPVRDGAHLDRAQDRLAEPAALQNVLERPHGLVITHVLIDSQTNTGFRA